jgi:transcriptional regulator with XRE-family HTH domain
MIYHNRGMKKEFKHRLCESRDALGLTQAELAAKFGKKQSFIGNLEAGSRKGTSLIAEIAHALGVDAYWLKTGVKTLVAGDQKIDNVVEAMKQTSSEGKAIVLHEARKALADYPLSKRKARVICMADWRIRTVQSIIDFGN